MTDDTTEEQTELTFEQRQRAEALAVARAVLVDSGRTIVTGSESLAKRFGTQDLIDVAQWVLDGTDPLAEYRRRSDGDDMSVGATSEAPPEAFGDSGEHAYPSVVDSFTDGQE
jgi:hypothetical protein